MPILVGIHWFGIQLMPLLNEMDSLRALQLLVRVVELGSFSAAAREAGLSQSTLSKAVASLEQNLGVRLLARTTTSLSLTGEGQRFYARGRLIGEDYQEAVAEARRRTRELSGSLRVNAPLGLGELRLNTLALAFLEDHPRMELELILNDRIVDLVEESVDVAIRLGDALPPDAVARQIAHSRRILAAAPTYLQRCPKIVAPEDIAMHQYYSFAGLNPKNLLQFTRNGHVVEVAVRGRFRVNSSMALRQALLQGAGLGSAPAWLLQDLIDTGELIELLPGWVLPGQALHLVYPSRRHLPLRVRAFLQFMGERLPALPGFA
jgi:DNA-binding transcriptional LysR family regulator